MKKQENMRMLRVEARGMVPLANGEAAQGGTALLAQNVRERESSLQVTGEPSMAGSIAMGDRLLLLSDGHTVTCRGRVVKIDGAPIATLNSDIVAAHAIGSLIVVVTEAGLIYLSCPADSWIVLDPADAAPQLAIGTDIGTVSSTIDAYTFDEPYSQWQAPLADADRSTLTARLRSAWSALSNDIHAEGRNSAPLLVRWAVRLVDGNYLWMSEPVRVGDATLSNADRIAAAVTTGGGRFTGIEASSLSLKHYDLDISVERDISAEWLPLVAAIDVFVTDEAHLLTASRSLDYRCVTRTTGGHEYVLEMGLASRSGAAIARELASSSWHLVASAPATAHVSGSDFVIPSEPLSLTNVQCSEVGMLPSLTDLVCSAAGDGRLYCCTRSGEVVVSAAGNALAASHHRSVLGALPIAMAVVTRPLYSGGFGRYPVYLFTDDGIYAIPQSATGMLGEARLVDRTVIAATVPPVEGGGDIWLLSRHGHLCRLSGSRLTVCHRDVDCTALAWCNPYSELWIQRASGYPVVMMDSGRMSVRTVAAVQLYSDPRHAVAVTVAGGLLDLEHETSMVMPVVWHSHPIALHPLLGSPVRRVVWHVSGEDVELTLSVTGQRGIMAQDVDVSVITVTGQVEQPLAAPTMMVPCRTLRLSLDGVARSGSLLLPTLVYSSTCHGKKNCHGEHII